MLFSQPRLSPNIRSSRLDVFCKKGVLENFSKFTGKDLRQSLFFSKAASLRPAALLKKRSWHVCFPVNFTKFLKTPCFIEHHRWLLFFYPTFPILVFQTLLYFLSCFINCEHAAITLRAPFYF